MVNNPKSDFIGEWYMWKKSVDSCDYLVESWKDVVGKLNLCNGSHSDVGEANAESSDTLLA